MKWKWKWRGDQRYWAHHKPKYCSQWGSLDLIYKLGFKDILFFFFGYVLVGASVDQLHKLLKATHWRWGGRDTWRHLGLPWSWDKQCAMVCLNCLGCGAQPERKGCGLCEMILSSPPDGILLWYEIDQK